MLYSMLVCHQALSAIKCVHVCPFMCVCVCVCVPTLMQWQPPANGKDTSGQLTLPERIHGYHTLLPLDTPATNNYQMQGGANPADTTSIALGVRTQVGAGTSRRGQACGSEDTHTHTHTHTQTWRT